MQAHAGTRRHTCRHTPAAEGGLGRWPRSGLCAFLLAPKPFRRPSPPRKGRIKPGSHSTTCHLSPRRPSDHPTYAISWSHSNTGKAARLSQQLRGEEGSPRPAQLRGPEAARGLQHCRVTSVQDATGLTLLCQGHAVQTRRHTSCESPLLWPLQVEARKAAPRDSREGMLGRAARRSGGTAVFRGCWQHAPCPSTCPETSLPPEKSQR